MLTATQLIHRISFFTLAGILPLACTVGGDGVDDVGVGGSPGDSGSDFGWGGSIGTGGAAAGGAMPTGGSGPTGGFGGGPTCESGVPAAPETYLCAGAAWEQTLLGHTWSHIEAQTAYYACGGDNYPEYPATGGSWGVGGSTNTGGTWSDDGDDGSGEDEGSGGVGYGGEGGFGTGGIGVGGVGTGGVVGIGGSATGGAGGGPFSDWCDGLDPFTAIAGVTFRQGECRLSDLKLPVRFQEPHGWYELRVYAGSSPCERDQLLAETSGYGLGQIVELPVTVAGDTFVSIELTSDQGWADGLIELNTFAAPPAL